MSSKYMCIDTETTGLSWQDDTLHGVGVGYAEGEARYYPFDKLPAQVISDLANPQIEKIGHNLHGFDAKFIKKAGYDINGPFHDTMVLANLVDDTQPLGLKELTDKYIGEENLERKRRLDRHMQHHGVNNVGALCAKDLLDKARPHFDIIADYCCEDVNNTLALFHILMGELQKIQDVVTGPPFGFKKGPIDYYFEEALPLERVLFEIEYRGIRVDLGAMERIKESSLATMSSNEARLNKIFAKRIPLVEAGLVSKAVRKEEGKYVNKPLKNPTPAAVARRQRNIDEAVAKFKAGTPPCQFSWSNTNHVAALLYQHCDLPNALISRTDKGAYQLDKEAVDKIKSNLSLADDKWHPLVVALDLYAEYKLCGKLANTYTGSNKKGIMSKIRFQQGVPRIFPEYRQTTSTGRLASSSPNLQNLKRDSEVKRFFIPDSPDLVFDDADYSQIELRTGAHVSDDVGLCESYANGIDVHLKTASRLFNRTITKKDDMERQAGKRTNFLTIFRGGAFRLREELKKDTGVWFTMEECKNFIAIWFDTYPGVKTYLDAQLEFFKDYKFCISETGRVRRLPDIYFGAHTEWKETGETEEGENGCTRKLRVPIYSGPPHKVEELVQSILLQNPKMQRDEVTAQMIGKEAWYRFSHACKAGYNLPIQSLAASITKRAMIQLHTAGRCIANQVHDSLVVARKRGDIAAKRQVINTMENAYPLRIPVVAECKTVSTFHPDDAVKETE